jgi:hypothetical protein
VNDTAHLALPVRTLQSVEIWSQSVSNEVHFTLEVETIFRPYLASHCSGVNETSNVVLTVHGTQAVQH